MYVSFQFLPIQSQHDYLRAYIKFASFTMTGKTSSRYFPSHWTLALHSPSIIGSARTKPNLLSSHPNYPDAFVVFLAVDSSGECHQNMQGLNRL